MHINIGGFQKNTLIDFPETLASLVFTQGCNFRCPYCHNPSLIPFHTFQTDLSETTFQNNRVKEWYQDNQNNKVIEVDEIFTFLKKRKGLIDGVVITGGEPTLQRELAQFCSKIKNIGFKVKLDTNGSRPEIIESLLKRGLVDFIAMDIKSNDIGYQHLVKRYESTTLINIGSKKVKSESKKIKYLRFDFSLIIKSIELIMQYAPIYEFRTTCVKPFISKEVMVEIGKMIKGASNYVLQHCSKSVKMFNPDFFQKQNPYPNPFFSDDEITEFKDIVKGYVQHCSIR